MNRHILPTFWKTLRHLAVVGLVLGAMPLGASAATASSGSCDDPQSLLESFLNERFSQPDADLDPEVERYRVVSFDHRTGKVSYWELQRKDPDSSHWTLEELTTDQEIERRFDGQALLTLRQDTGFVTVVTDTNPVLYRAEAGKVERADIEELNGLKQLAGLFLGFVSSVANAEADQALLKAVKPAPPGPEAVPGPCKGTDAEILSCLVERAIRSLPTPPSLGQLSFAIQRVTSTAEDADRLGARFYAALQATELGKTTGVEFPDLQGDLPTQDRLKTEFDAVGKVLDPVREVDLPCHGSANQILPLFSDHLAAEPPDVAWNKRIAAARAAVEKCEVPGTNEALGKLVSWFDDKEPGKLDPSDLAMREALRFGVTQFRTVAGVSQSLTAVVAKAEEVLKTRAKAAKDLAALQLVADRVEEVRAENPHGDTLAALPQWLACGMLELERKTGRELDLPFFKTQTEAFSVSALDPLATQITLARAKKTDFAYTVRRPAGVSFGIDAGVIWTDQSDPTFSAATKELDEIDPATGMAKTVKVIDRTDEDSLAGELVVFLSVIPAVLDTEAVDFGLHLGLGVDGDKPSLYLGGKAEWKGLVLGGGISWHEVTKLAGGQRSFHEAGLDEATRVTADGDIKTTSSFPPELYLTVAFSLDDLPFFGK